jgi:hypothetical protein
LCLGEINQEKYRNTEPDVFRSRIRRK